jgi:hypothetical protein
MFRSFGLHEYSAVSVMLDSEFECNHFAKTKRLCTQYEPLFFHGYYEANEQLEEN